ncbi:MAG: CBS domain-containing protein [Bacteroidota bacterium]
MRIQVKDFMSTPVKTTIEEKRLGDLRRIMIATGIHAFPVVQYTKTLPEVEIHLKGIITATDLCEHTNDWLFVKDIMTPKVHIIHKHSSAQAAAKMMLKKQVHHLVVMDDGKIVGMVSSLDFAKLVAEHTLD